MRNTFTRIFTLKCELHGIQDSVHYPHIYFGTQILLAYLLSTLLEITRVTGINGFWNENNRLLVNQHPTGVGSRCVCRHWRWAC